MKRREEYGGEFLEISKRYEPVINKALENNDIVILEKAMDEEREEYNKLKEKYKDIDFMLT